MKNKLKLFITIVINLAVFGLFAVFTSLYFNNGKLIGIVGLILAGIMVAATSSIWKKSKNI